MVPRTCEHCTKPLTRHFSPSDIAKGEGRFCSVICSNKAKFGKPEDRFWKSVQKSDACWLWTASVDKDGYGKIYVNGKLLRAHVYSFMLHHGEVPKGAYVCHECDTPGCVNPTHLWLGNALLNNRDASSKGRSTNGAKTKPECTPRGMSSGNAKFTDDQIRSIRELYASGGISQQRIADMYGVVQTCISSIVRRKQWKHI